MKWTPIIAIITIALLSSIALLQGIDGVLLGGSIAIIGGIGGYEAKALRDKRKGGE